MQAVTEPAQKQTGVILVALLVFMAIAIILTVSAVTVTIINIQTATKYAVGTEALQNAETGADNALLRLLRDPNYAGETLTLGNGTATITVSGTTTKTIQAVGVSGTFRRTIQVVGTQTNNTFSITSWSEL